MSKYVEEMSVIGLIGNIPEEPDDDLPEDNVPEDQGPESIIPGDKTAEENPSDISTEIEVPKEPIQLSLPATAGIALGASVVAVLATLGIQKLLHSRKKENEPVEEFHVTEQTEEVEVSPWINAAEIRKTSVGKVHDIGKRNYQQDSFGITRCQNGVMAVVADGMGGLSDGDKVSQKIVMTMLQESVKISLEQRRNALFPVLSVVNREVNNMLSRMGQGRSGSTVVAVLANQNRFHWASVGDSRIYLYRSGKLIQINSEHIYEKELMNKAINHYITFSEAMQDRQRNRVTSYIGMGDLKYVEGSLNAIETCPGDKILIMSDGIFNTLTEAEISAVMMGTSCAEEAAKILGDKVVQKEKPKQDNYTALILDF